MRLDSAMLLLLAVEAGAFAADSREATARTVIAGSSGKSWVHVTMKVFLGSQKKCTQGEAWLFRPNGSGRIDRCVEGKLASEETTWSLHVIDALDMGLTIGSRDYVLLLPELGNGKKKGTMVLRRRSDTKSVPTEDLEFTFETE